jgi:radical SAM enzyme (TIGR01210 family)
LFINNVMNEMWQEVSREYQNVYSQCLQMDETALFLELRKQKMGVINYPGVTMNLLVTSGCGHKFKNGKVAGCCMCDYHSDFTLTHAAMAALRERNIDLYAKVMLESFLNVRGKETEPNIFELISGNDSLNPFEFPDESFIELFESNHLFKSKPFKYIFEARASSVTNERVNFLKNRLGEKARIVFELGIEVGNEWIRNYWINKDVTNAAIEDAIKIIHEAKCKVSTDILIGIPGLTEEQSIHLFKDTVKWLDRIGADEIVCLPLNRKKRTLHGFIYQELKNNERLGSLGLVQDEHTGLPWLFTVIRAINDTISENPKTVKKLRVAQLNPERNSIWNTIPYNDKKECECNTTIIKRLEEFGANPKCSALQETFAGLKSDPCYDKYRRLIEKQDRAGDIDATIRILGEELAPKIWPADWTTAVEKLKHDLLLFRP